MRCALLVLFALVVRCLLFDVWWLLAVVLCVVVLFVVLFVPRIERRMFCVECRVLLVAWCLSFEVFCMLLFNECCVLSVNWLRDVCSVLVVAVRNVLLAACFVLLSCWLLFVADCCLMCVVWYVQCVVRCLLFVACVLFDGFSACCAAFSMFVVRRLRSLSLVCVGCCMLYVVCCMLFVCCLFVCCCSVFVVGVLLLVGCCCLVVV